MPSHYATRWVLRGGRGGWSKPHELAEKRSKLREQPRAFLSGLLTLAGLSHRLPPLRLIVAIDGPAGSGKSTTARRVADRMGWLYLDTGAMYRAVGLAFLDRSAPFSRSGAEEVLQDIQIGLEMMGNGIRVLLNGEEVSDRIRTPEASEAASRVSALPSVRKRMVEEQRRIARIQLARERGVVMEGRDIGTVVFPDADVKVYLVADPLERARRRHAELAERGDTVTLESVASDLAARDARDISREIAPLHKAHDALEVDTTGLTLDEQVDRVLALVHQRLIESR